MLWKPDFFDLLLFNSSRLSKTLGERNFEEFHFDGFSRTFSLLNGVRFKLLKGNNKFIIHYITINIIFDFSKFKFILMKY